MTTSHLPYHPVQAHLLPLSAARRLPEGHPACLLADTVESLELSVFPARNARGGPRQQAFHPAMTARALLYGGATGALPNAVWANTGHRGEAALETLADQPCWVSVAPGHEGREQARTDAQKSPHTARMAERLKCAESQAACRRKAIVKVPNAGIRSVRGFGHSGRSGLRSRAELCMPAACSRRTARRWPRNKAFGLGSSARSCLRRAGSRLVA